MSLIPDELKVQHFPCPNCGQFINDEVESCKFCSTTITAEKRGAALEKERAEKKKIFLNSEKRTVLTGLVIVGIGLANIIMPTFDFYVYNFGTKFPCLSSIAVIIGLGVSLFGLQRYSREKRSF